MRAPSPASRDDDDDNSTASTSDTAGPSLGQRLPRGSSNRDKNVATAGGKQRESVGQVSGDKQQRSRQRRKKRVPMSQLANGGHDDGYAARVQSGRRAFDSLLGGRADSVPGQQDGCSEEAGGAQGYYNEYDDDDGSGRAYGDAASMLSHVSLDQAPTYGRLVAAHVLSLLPCVALLLATFMLVWHAPCHVRPHPKDRAAERKACGRLLSDRVSISAFGIGIICWLAAYALRPALWKLLETGMMMGRTARREDHLDAFSATEREPLLSNNRASHETDATQLSSRMSERDARLLSVAATVQFVLLKTIALEMLRLFSVLLANALVIAGLVRTPYWHSDGKLVPSHPNVALPPDLRWHLHWYDPRFTVGVWLAIGWATTEFIVTSWQMFDRLALYACDFEPTADADDVENRSWSLRDRYGAVSETTAMENSQAAAYDTRQSYLSDAEGAGDYSDSAATVRGPVSTTDTPNMLTNGDAGGREAQIERTDSKPVAFAGSTQGLAPTQPSTERRAVAGQSGQSGFSISPSEFQSGRLRQRDLEEDEHDAAHWSALREKLDAEMDTLQKARSRVELEQTFGQPLTSVPIVLCTLWRIDGWLWNLGSTLLMSASVTLAQGSLVEGSHAAAPPLFPPLAWSATTLATLILLHWLFTSMWTLALPRLGFAAVTYTSMLVGVGLCLAASARWGLLV